MCELSQLHTVRRGVGSVFVWGYGHNGRLGLGDTGGRLAPTVVPALQGVCLVTGGSAFLLSQGMDGTVMAWGRSRFGELGLGDIPTRLEPTIVQGLRHVVDIAAGYEHTIAVTLEMHLYQWGVGYGKIPLRVVVGDGVDRAVEDELDRAVARSVEMYV